MTSAPTAISSHPKWYKDWLAWFLIISILYGMLTIVVMGINIGRPFPGFLTSHNAHLQRIDIEWNVPAWWWFSGGDAPEIGDVLLEVDGIPFSNLAETVDEGSIYALALQKGRAHVPVSVERQGQPLILNVAINRFSWSNFLDFRLAPAIVGLCFGLMAYVLYRASGTDPRQRLVIFVLLIVGMLIAALHPTLFLFGRWVDTLLGFLNPLHAFASAFVGAALIHLALRFPYPIWPQFSRWILVAAYGIATLLFLAFEVSHLHVWLTNSFQPIALTLDSYWLPNMLYFLLVGILSVIARLGWDAFKPQSHSRRSRKEARIILIAFLILLPAVILATNSIVSGSNTLVFLRYLADTRYLVLVLPLGFAILTLRYDTFSGAERWVLLVLLLAVGGILANITLGLLFWHVPESIRLFPISPIALLFGVFFISSLFWSRQSGWEGWLGRMLQWERINYQQVQQFGQALANRSFTSEEQLAQAVADGLCETLGTEHSAVYLQLDQQLVCMGRAGTRSSAAPPLLPLPEHAPTKPLRLEPTSAEWLQPLRPETVVVMPLTGSDALLGLVELGPRWDSAVFDDRTLNILDLISQQITVSCQNTQQSAKLRQMDQDILEMQEQTQIRMAQDVHDHVLPTLTQVQFQLESTILGMHDDPALAEKSLRESLNRLNESTIAIRQIQQNLVIRPLEYGLRPYLEEMIWRMNHETEIRASAEIPDNLDDLITDLPRRKAIFAIAKQALDNVIAHANASAVTFTITLPTPSTLLLEIYDNGQGVSQERLEQAAENSRFGMRSMQLRAQSLSGTCTFQSEPGQGSRLTATIPLTAQ